VDQSTWLGSGWLGLTGPYVRVCSSFVQDRLADDVDLEHVASKTKNFTGSDLHNLCREAAYVRIRERMADTPFPGDEDGETKGSEGAPEGETKGSEGETNESSKSEELRAISKKDFKLALKVARPSVAENGEVSLVRQWNSEYGDFGSKKAARRNLSMYT